MANYNKFHSAKVNLKRLQDFKAPLYNLYKGIVQGQGSNKELTPEFDFLDFPEETPESYKDQVDQLLMNAHHNEELLSDQIAATIVKLAKLLEIKEEKLQKDFINN